jgi:hypothetical protein
MSVIKVEAWYAMHTGGTKFYQIVRFIAGGKVSFALQHNGANALFTGIGKIASGQIRKEEVTAGVRAGKKKEVDKKGDGYTELEQTKSWTFASQQEFNGWARNQFGKAAIDVIKSECRSSQWINAVSSTSSTPAPAWEPPPAPTIDKGMEEHPEFGSW